MERKIPEFGWFAEPSLLILASLRDGPGAWLLEPLRASRLQRLATWGKS